MPETGEIKMALEIGKGKTNRRQKYIWSACQGCGKERWVVFRNGRPKHSRCNVCTCKLKQVNWHPKDWVSGTVIKDGYVSLRLEKEDFFYPMARQDGYVFEHRLVVAKALGRCLRRWEVVHHKGVKYPKGSIENKQDNRYPENLQLISGDRHNQITILENKISYLERRVILIEAENIILKGGI